LAGVGLIVWLGLSILGGFTESGFRLREAWDTALYLYVGLPIMALAVACSAVLHPSRAWRWPIWLVGGHALGVILTGIALRSGPTLLVPTTILGIMLVVLFAIPAYLAVGARALYFRSFS
jgi:hypothetical protein